MQVKVKKDVLFNLLKKALNENRTFDNPSGNFIHSFDRQETPIVPSHMASRQLSVEEPPVGDENYVPGSISELRSAASRIAEEVPPDQIEEYYRALHKLLDAALDKSNEGMLAESGRMFSINDMFGRGDDDRYSDTTYDEYEDEEFGSSVSAGGSLEDVMADPAFVKLKKKYKKNKFYDGMEEIQFLSDKHSVSYTEIEDALMSNQFDTEKASSDIVTTPTPARTRTKPEKSTDVTRASGIDLEDDEDLPDISDEDYDRLLGGIGELEREPFQDNKQHKALKNSYWENALTSLAEKKVHPLEAVAQAVVDSMDAISRVIATEVSVKYGFGGGDPGAEFAGSPEERAWKGILSNGVNTNHEVIYKLPADKKTPEFWKKRVLAFMNKLQSGSAGSLSDYSRAFTRLASSAFDMYEEDSGLSIMKFMDQIANRVTESILFDPNYGGQTRNIASSETQLLSKLIDTGFSAQIKKAPFNIPTKATFKARDLDPNEQIEHAGEQKTMKDAIVDAVVAYTIVKSDEFKRERRELGADLSNESRDQAIQQIISNISESETFTFTSGTGKRKQSFVINKSDIVAEVNAYVDQKFAESQDKEEVEYLSDEEISEIEAKLEDPNVSTAEKKEAITDEIGSQIMRNVGSISNYKNYVYRVLSKKFDMAQKGLEDLDDPDKMGEANYITIFNDTLAEIIPSTEEALIAIAKDGASQGLDQEDLKPFIEAITQIRAIKEFVYSPATRGGENTIEKLKGNVFNIEGDQYDALEFFSDSRNVGPAILRSIVGDLIGSSLKGPGMQQIETINFAFEKKVKRQAENIEEALKAEILNLFSGINLKEAQDAAYVTAQEIGVKETKAKFLEPNMKDLQIKMVYPFVGRVKRMPDFSKMNPAARNFVCWFTAIADKRSGGAATMDERTAVAKELFENLMAMGKGEIDTASNEVEKAAEKIDQVINKSLSEVEALEDFTQKEVARIRKNSDLMKRVVKQAMKMHLDDIQYFEGAEAEA
jgi:hypothetical protein